MRGPIQSGPRTSYALKKLWITFLLQIKRIYCKIYTSKDSGLKIVMLNSFQHLKYRF